MATRARKQPPTEATSDIGGDKATDVSAPTEPKEPQGWTITLDGTDRPLVPSHLALATAERIIKRPLYRILNDGIDDGLTVDDLAALAVALDPASAKSLDPGPMGSTALIEMAAPALLRAMRPAIVGAGIMYATAKLLAPLSAALHGHTDAAGVRKTKEQ